METVRNSLRKRDETFGKTERECTYIKILFSDEIPGGARRRTQSARVYF